MVRILRGEVRHLAGGDVDLDDVLVVRILARGGGQAVGIGQDETALLVHLVDLADVPFPAGDLAHRKRLGVNDIQVPPVVPFRDPQDMLPVLEQIAPEVVVIDERVSLFLRQRADLAGRGVHGGEFIDLMAALVVLIGEEVRIRGPLAQGQEILVPRDGPVQGDGLPGLHVEQGRGALRQPVAGLRIVQPTVARLHLVVGTGHAEQNLALLQHFLLQGGELLAVRRPLDLRIGLSVGPVKAQLAGFGTIGLGEPDIVVPDEGDERAVRGKALYITLEGELAFVGRVVIARAGPLRGLLELVFGDGGLRRPGHLVPDFAGRLVRLEDERVLPRPDGADGAVVQVCTDFGHEFSGAVRLVKILGPGEKAGEERRRSGKEKFSYHNAQVLSTMIIARLGADDAGFR